MAHAEQNNSKLKPNVPRILAAVTYVLQLGEKTKRSLSQYDVVKTLFLSDRAHLNEWGRPITYDNYVAMEHGPVPSLTYDILKGNAYAMRKHGIGSLPWKSTLVPNGKGKRRYDLLDNDIVVEDHLSESDMESLDTAFEIVSRLTFGQIRRLTHEDPAYLAAWQESGNQSAYDMQLALLFEEANDERAEIIASQSLYV